MSVKVAGNAIAVRIGEPTMHSTSASRPIMIVCNVGGG
jgi:hypothetical protein